MIISTMTSGSAFLLMNPHILDNDPTRTRTGINRLGGGCPIQLCYGAKNTCTTIFSFIHNAVKRNYPLVRL